MSADRRRVVVVGGGVAGLATSALLAADGWEVELLEQRDELGGRAGSWAKDGFRFDTGPSWYLMPEVFDHFYRLLGTSAAEQLDLEVLDPGYRVYFEGEERPLETRVAREDNKAVFESFEPGAGAQLDAYLDQAGETYQVALRHFLYTSFERVGDVLNADVLRRAPQLLPLLLRSLKSHVHSRFSDRRLQQVLGYPAVFLGGSPERIPALYHLMSSMDLDDGVLYPQGGFAAFVDTLVSLATELGVTIRTGATVTSIDTVALPGAKPWSRRKAAVCGVAYRGQDGAEQRVAADVVVGAADLHHLETRLLPSDLQTYPESWWRRRDPGPGAVLVYLGVTGELPELAHHTMFFTEDWETNFDGVLGDRRGHGKYVPDPASSYVCRPSATDASVAPEGAENLFVLVPVPADVDLGRGGLDGQGDPAVERVADAAIAQVASWAGIPDLAERIVVRRTVGPGDFAGDLNAWSGTMLGPGHRLSQSAFFRASNVSKKVEGLLYAGSSTLPGIGLPMCLISAELVLKRLRGDRVGGMVATPLVARRELETVGAGRGATS
ncbi:phytoene desaturase family protein [Nocardioides daphniae]|uniref:Phytoene desaturase n=1 Tax=Nocardioides daphniae TaxID=402297 RepID=A0ABQ1QMZ2_9ACTN|nr:phytoene desaturase family protein [Nocardioides daphniae]GGD30620.1 phytoene desaturase [Nocardioides daphniae]